MKKIRRYGFVVHMFGALMMSEVAHASPIVFDPSLYHLLTITDLGTGSPGINNNGEIIYTADDGNGNQQVFSNIRGQVTSSTTGGNLRFPDINDAGEVVYSDFAPGGFRVYSSTRGLISEGRGNSPSINNLGEIAYTVEYGNDPEDGIHTNLRGLVVGVESPRSPAITDSGEIIYSARDENYKWHIYSTTHGKLVEAQGSGLINNFGDILLAKDDSLFTLDGAKLTNFRIGSSADMNDHGDIVVSAYEVDNSTGSFRVVLMTQRPEFYAGYGYEQYEPQISDVPLPGSIVFLLSGISGFLAFGRKRSRRV